MAASTSVGLDGTYVLGLDRCDASVAAALSNQQVTMSDVGTLTSKHKIKEAHKSTISGVKFVADDSNLLYTTSHDGSLKLWDIRLDCSKAATTFSQGADVKQLKPLTAFDSNCNGRLLCAGTEQVSHDSFLLFWDARNPPNLMGGYWDSHEDDVTTVRCHPTNPDRLASGGTDGIVNVFDLSQTCEDDAIETTINSESSVQRLSWFHRDSSSPTADSLCCITHTEEASLWKVEDVAPYKTISREDACIAMKRKVTETAYLADAFETAPGDLLLLAGSSYAKSPCLRLAEVSKKGKLKPYANLAKPKTTLITRCSVFTPASGEIVTGGEDGIICVWRPAGAADQGETTPAAAGGKIKKGKKSKATPY